ncbi:MAG: ABC transporter ATP-binding protein [Planctomycetota bacterium]|nr:ABC transporter ATP-binding protein [Planctomycetota bacterium]
MSPAVCAESLSASYREAAGPVAVLRAATFTVARGGLTALTGPSGSGKTTLLSLLGGLDRPESGRLVVNGIDLTALDRAGLSAFRRVHVGFVFQGFNLLPTLTVRENTVAGLEPLGLRRLEARARADEALDRVGLLDKAHRFPHELSGGEQQRAAVARACAKNPPLLLADEPTGNLDEEAGARVMDLIAAAAHDGAAPRTVIVVTHDPAVAARADHVLALRDHRVVPG